MFKYHCSNCGKDIMGDYGRPVTSCPDCGAEITDAADHADLLPAGFQLGGFEIRELVGKGSFGTVYLATQLSMGRECAVKVLNSNVTGDPAAIAQFFEEIKTIGQLQHANIVCAFEAGHDNDQYFLAMQYVPGTTMEDIVSEKGPMKPLEALPRIKKVAEALQYAWEKFHLCHRDIKPGNVIIHEETGAPMLLDFGTALRSGENTIQDGLVEGSPFYMSPEQCKGQPLSFASDMYSLGASLYQILTGVPPYTDPDVTNILRMHCSAPFPSPAKNGLKVTFPPAVEALLKKMMAKTPGERFKSWGELIRHIDKVTALLKKQATGKQAAVPPPPKKRSGAVVFYHIISTLLVAGVAYYILSTKYTNAAEELYISMQEEYKKVLEDPQGSPAHVIKLMKGASEASRKFAVKKELREKIQAEYASVMELMEEIQKEKPKIEQFRSYTGALIEEAEELLQEAENSQEPAAKLGDILQKIRIFREDYSRMEFRSFKNKSAADEDKTMLDSMIDRIQELQQTASAEKAEKEKQKPLPAEVDESRARAEEEARKEAEEEERRLREEQLKKDAALAKKKIRDYERLIRRERRNRLSGFIRDTRTGKFGDAKSKLQMPGSLKTDDPLLQELLESVKQEQNRLLSMLNAAEPVLKKLSRSGNKKNAILETTYEDPDLQYYCLLLSGYFQEAEKFVKKEDEELFRELVVSYLEPRLKRARENVSRDNGKELHELWTDYGKLEIFRQLEKKYKK